MSDTQPRNQTSASQRLADALLRSVGGTLALLRMTSATTDTNQMEVGLLATQFVDAVISPVVIRKLRPQWKEAGESKYELMVSASSVATQVNALSLLTAQALFALTLAVIVDGKEYSIESVSANEAFGAPYMYRLLMRESLQQAV